MLDADFRAGDHGAASLGIELLNVVCHQCQATGERLSGHEQIVRADALTSGIADVDGLKETFRPGLRPRRLKDHGIAILTDEHGCWQVNALGQAKWARRSDCPVNPSPPNAPQAGSD